MFLTFYGRKQHRATDPQCDRDASAIQCAKESKRKKDMAAVCHGRGRKMPTIDTAGDYLAPTDIVKECVVTFADAGEIVTKEWDGKQKRRLEIGISMPDGSKKKWTPNWTTQEEIAKAYGRATEQWVGKQARLWTAKQAVQGKMLLVIYGEAIVAAEEAVA